MGRYRERNRGLEKLKVVEVGIVVGRVWGGRGFRGISWEEYLFRFYSEGL